jgi:hypothetical protein
LRYPLDKNIVTLVDVPYTISYVIRKRSQLDTINELPKEKRPDDFLFWDKTSEELDNWFDRVFKKNESQTTEIMFSMDEIER